MPVLLIRFPARRYHATPAGHHVNEGLVEWPPSPWRLLRALLAVGYGTLGWPADGPPPVAVNLIERLATMLPRYRVPRAVGAHSRHYMPLAVLNKDRGIEKTTLVFDTWARIDDGGVLAVQWDVDLGADETALLEALVARLGYLGRSESWVEVRLAGAGEPLPDGDECRPCAGIAHPGPGWEQVPLLAALAPSDYRAWREPAVAAVLAELPEPASGRRKPTAADRKLDGKRRQAQAPYPADLVGCLQMSTADLHTYGWSQPPGSRRVLYWRRSAALEAGAPRLRRPPSGLQPVPALLLAMSTVSGNDHALPVAARTLAQAERLHHQFGAALARANAGHSAVLSGRDGQRRPLAGPHVHAHILPLDLDGDGHLEHVLVWAPMGLDGKAQAAVSAVSRTFAKGGIGPLCLARAGGGALDDLRTLPGVFGDGLRSVLGPPAGASRWVSLTPFVPPRHLKPHGRNSLAGQVAAELESRGQPRDVEVRVLDPHDDERARRQRHFVRVRRNGAAPPVDCGFALELRFTEPVQGPLCLGYGSHFGLGLFAATDPVAPPAP